MWPVVAENARKGYEELKAKFIIDTSKLTVDQDISRINPLNQDEDVS